MVDWLHMRTHVVVDGSNIATEGRSTPSLAQLDEAVRAFMDQHPAETITVVVDASFGHRIAKSEVKAFDDAIDAGEIITPPAGVVGRGDAFILEVAERADATVLSNDSFQEFHGDHPWLFEEERLIGGKPVPEVGWVFLPRTPVRGPASRRATRDKKKADTSASGSSDGGSSGGGSGGGRSRRGRGSGGSAKKATGEKATGEKATGKQASADKTTKAAGKRGGRKKASGQASGSAASASETDEQKRPTKAEPLNEALPFIEFVGENPVGTPVRGTVERFTSHGAHVMVEDVRCYVELAGLGDPPPNRARDVLTKDEEHDFVILAVDTPRRGIDLAVPGSAAAKEADLPDAPKKGGGAKKGGGGRGRGRGGRGKGDDRGGGDGAGTAKKASKRTSKKAAAKKASGEKASKASGTRSSDAERSKKAAAKKGGSASAAGGDKGSGGGEATKASSGRAKRTRKAKKSSGSSKGGSSKGGSGSGRSGSGSQEDEPAAPAAGRPRGAASAPIEADDEPRKGGLRGALGRIRRRP